MLEKINRAVHISFLGLFFFVPLVWAPVNFELFEFNKIILVYFFTLLIGCLWLLKMVLAKKVIFIKTFLFWPLVVFFISQVLSTIFSIDPHTSFYGYYSRFHGGLLSTTSYLILYFALASNGKRDWVKKIIDVSLASGLLVSLYGIAEHFGIDKNLWVQDVQRRVFSTLGQPNWLAAYLDIFLMIILGRAIFEKGAKQKNISYLLLAVFYLCLLFTKSKSGILGFGIGLIVYGFLVILPEARRSLLKKKKSLLSYKIPFSILLFLSILIGTPFSPSLVSVLANKPIEKLREGGLGTEVVVSEEVGDSALLNITPSGGIRKIVWQGAIDLWRQKPILGTGVETFAYSYYWVRPVAHNLTSEWDFLYNKAHNEYLNFAATSGTVGLVSYLAISLSFFYWVYKKSKKGSKKDNWFLWISASCLTTILVTNFFGFSVVAVGLWFFLIPAVCFLGREKKDEKELPLGKIGNKEKMLIVGVVLVFSIGLTKIINYWRADTFFAKGKSLEAGGNFKASYDFLKRAIDKNSSEPNFYSQFGLTLADLAYLSFQSKLDDQAQQMVNEAVRASDISLSISPYHLNFYKDRARMFYILSKHDPSYLENSLESLLSAIVLAPTDAKLYYNAGLMYQAIGDSDMAVNYLEKAVELKPNFDQAVFWLDEIKK